MKPRVSRVEVDYGIVAALAAAEAVLECRADWRAANEVQTRFITDVFAGCRDEAPHLSEIEAVASREASSTPSSNNAVSRPRSSRLDPPSLARPPFWTS
jgi:hypothetical protein